MERRKGFVRFLCLLTTLFFALGWAVFLRAERTYAAAETGSLPLDVTDVSEDLASLSEDGTAFDPDAYALDADGGVRVLFLAEYGYGYYENRRDDFALYLYVLNEPGTSFSKEEGKSRITLRFGGDAEDGYEKYGLTFLSESAEEGRERLFLKYRVSFSDEEQTAALSALSADLRIYEISEIELTPEGEDTVSYAGGCRYGVSGYAAGFGRDPEGESTLSCTAEESETLSLDVRPVYYRPEGTNGSEYMQDTLHAVYFSVPDGVLERYGTVSAVHASWLNARTAPIFVTGNAEMYAAFSAVEGEEDPDTDAAFRTNGTGRWIGGMYFSDYSHAFNCTEDADTVLTCLPYVFYAENGDADDYVLPAETVLARIAAGSEEGGEVAGKYSGVFFSEWDGEYTDLTIGEEDGYVLTEAVSTERWWARFWGSETSFLHTYTVPAIEEVPLSEMGDADAFCAAYYVDEYDFDGLYAYTEQAEADGETVFLFRYLQTEYFSAELSEGYKKTGFYVSTLATGQSMLLYGSHFAEEDTNAFLAQMWVQLDFDVIDITFAGEETEIVLGVAADPQDILADVTSPVETEGDSLPWWSYAAGALGVAAGLCVLWLLFRLFRVPEPAYWGCALVLAAAGCVFLPAAASAVCALLL